MHKLVACVFLSLVALAAGALEKDSCYKSVTFDICSYSSDGKKKSDTACNAKYSGFSHVHADLQQFVMTQIEQSFQYLTMATKFGNYKSNRPGFEKLYKKLADKSWEDSIELIKYITSRGYDMDLKNAPHTYSTIMNLGDVSTYAAVSEMKSLSLALEMNKFLAEKAHDIHRSASKMGHVSETLVGKLADKHEMYHDAEVMSFLENEYVHKHADTIRTLTGHVNDLHKITHDGTDAHLATYMFDEFLLKA